MAASGCRSPAGKDRRRAGPATGGSAAGLRAGLNTADAATVGAIAPELEAALNISDTGIGLLVTASTGVGAISTLPMGMLADRINRTRMLTVAIVIWSAAMVISGAVPSYPMLLISRLALGVVVGAAAPAVASLIGDMFEPEARGRIYAHRRPGAGRRTWAGADAADHAGGSGGGSGNSAGLGALQLSPRRGHRPRLRAGDRRGRLSHSPTCSLHRVLSQKIARRTAGPPRGDTRFGLPGAVDTGRAV